MQDLALASDFDAATKDDWLALVAKALKGADFDRRLVGRTLDGLELRPLYTRADLEGVVADGTPGRAPFTRGGNWRSASCGWTINQIYAFDDAGEANAAILDDLAGGTGALTLQLATPGQFGLATRHDAILAALDGVYLDMVDVFLVAGDQYIGAAAALTDAWERAGIEGARRRGGILADPLGTLAATGALEHDAVQSLQTFAHFVANNAGDAPQLSHYMVDARPYHEAGASEAQELAISLSTLAEYLRSLDEVDVAPASALRAGALWLAVDDDMFLGIAKLRAARKLVWRLGEACGAGEAAGAMAVMAATSQRMLSRRDVHVNLLRNTVGCSAAIIGGADVISVLPFTWPLGRPDSLARRLARNTQIILQEESSLAAVADGAGGSWYVERLTDDLARKAWELFQLIEREGGILKALASGWIQARIGEAASARLRQLRTGQAKLTGLTAFPNLDEQHQHVSPHPEPAKIEFVGAKISPLPARRVGAEFEALRDAADGHGERTGKRATIYLANIGKPADFSARAGFAASIFAAGGVATISGPGGEDEAAIVSDFIKSGLRVACICSRDEIYAAAAAPLASALNAAGAELILLAGHGGDQRSTLELAGIASFAYDGCDMLELLRGVHAALDMNGAGDRSTA